MRRESPCFATSDIDKGRTRSTFFFTSKEYGFKNVQSLEDLEALMSLAEADLRFAARGATPNLLVKL